MKTYKVNKINFDDVYLSQSIEIECSDGIKREIDSFYVKEIPTAQTAEVMFRNGKIKIDLLKKRIKYDDGKMYIKVGKTLYNIGEYEEV